MKNKKMTGAGISVPMERITRSILLIRGQKVLLDEDLAELYGVETKLLNRAIKRNQDRFPEDFLFQLTPVEFKNLRFQFGTSRWGGRRYPPYAFTEHGAIMAATDARDSRRFGAQACSAGEALRHPIQGGVRCHP